MHTEPIIVRACSKNQQDESELFPGINTHTANQLFSENETGTNKSSEFISQNQQRNSGN